MFSRNGEYLDSLYILLSKGGDPVKIVRWLPLAVFVCLMVLLAAYGGLPSGRPDGLGEITLLGSTAVSGSLMTPPTATTASMPSPTAPKPPVWTPTRPTIAPPIPTPYHPTDDVPLPQPNAPGWKRIEAVNGRYPTKGYAELLLVIAPENAGWSFHKYPAADSFPATPTVDSMWVREDGGKFTVQDERVLAEMFTLSDSAAVVVHLSDGVTDVVAP